MRFDRSASIAAYVAIGLGLFISFWISLLSVDKPYMVFAVPFIVIGLFGLAVILLFLSLKAKQKKVNRVDYSEIFDRFEEGYTPEQIINHIDVDPRIVNQLYLEYNKLKNQD